MPQVPRKDSDSNFGNRHARVENESSNSSFHWQGKCYVSLADSKGKRANHYLSSLQRSCRE